MEIHRVVNGTEVIFSSTDSASGISQVIRKDLATRSHTITLQQADADSFIAVSLNASLDQKDSLTDVEKQALDHLREQGLAEHRVDITSVFATKSDAFEASYAEGKLVAIAHTPVVRTEEMSVLTLEEWERKGIEENIRYLNSIHEDVGAKGIHPEIFFEDGVDPNVSRNFNDSPELIAKATDLCVQILDEIVWEYLPEFDMDSLTEQQGEFLNLILGFALEHVKAESVEKDDRRTVRRSIGRSIAFLLATYSVRRADEGVPTVAFDLRTRSVFVRSAGGKVLESGQLSEDGVYGYETTIYRVEKDEKTDKTVLSALNKFGKKEKDWKIAAKNEFDDAAEKKDFEIDDTNARQRVMQRVSLEYAS